MESLFIVKVVFILVSILIPIACGVMAGKAELRLLEKCVIDTGGAYQTVMAHCDASEAWWKWVDAHPMDSHSHPEAQRLLRIYIGSYMLFLGAHPYIDGREHLASLVSQMEDWVL